MPPRTKNANIRREEDMEEEYSEQEYSEQEEEEEDLSERYMCPFQLNSEWEGEVFKKFNESEITTPHYLDLDLIKDLRLEGKVMRLLKNLGMDTFARNIKFSGYDPLCYEFLTTMSVRGDKKKITVRMNGREYIVSLARMKATFGFSSSGESERPRSFNANQAWTELTGFDNWNSSGMPNGFIKDPALVIVHKFLAYNVSGKEQANKVNANEVYLLSCALNGTKVCISQFIWSAMTQMQKRSSAHASFCPIVTGLAFALGVLTNTEGAQDGHEEIKPEFIDFSELKGAQLISDRITIVPHAKRQCVRSFVHSEIAAGCRPPIFGDSGAGTSSAAGGNEEEDNEDEDQEEEERGNEDQQAGGSMSGDYYQRFHDDLTSFCDHFDASIGSLRQDINTDLMHKTNR